jgi:hypothetical protein
VNLKPDPYTGIEGVATFPRFIFMAGYQMRFGGRLTPPRQPGATGD